LLTENSCDVEFREFFFVVARSTFKAWESLAKKFFRENRLILRSLSHRSFASSKP